nr:MAG TPA: hypothetical protein [Caudoviricetes sp.]
MSRHKSAESILAFKYGWIAFQMLFENAKRTSKIRLPIRRGNSVGNSVRNSLPCVCKKRKVSVRNSFRNSFLLH